MAAITIGLAGEKDNFSKLTSEINRTGKPVTVLKNNKPWVVIQPAATAIDESSIKEIAVDFMHQYSDVFEALSN